MGAVDVGETGGGTDDEHSAKICNGDGRSAKVKRGSSPEDEEEMCTADPATRTAERTAKHTAASTATHTATCTATSTATHSVLHTTPHTATNTATYTATNTATNTAARPATHLEDDAEAIQAETVQSKSAATHTANHTATSTATHAALRTATHSEDDAETSKAKNDKGKSAAHAATNTATHIATYIATHTADDTDTEKVKCATHTAPHTATHTAAHTATHTATHMEDDVDTKKINSGRMTAHPIERRARKKEKNEESLESGTRQSIGHQKSLERGGRGNGSALVASMTAHPHPVESYSLERWVQQQCNTLQHTTTWVQQHGGDQESVGGERQKDEERNNKVGIRKARGK